MADRTIHTGDQSPRAAAFYDLRRLFSFRDILRNLSPRDTPQALWISPARQLKVSRVGVLSGSFNPPTVAHVELARRAKTSFGLECILFNLSRVIIDKEHDEGCLLEDRLLLLSLISDDLGWSAAVVTNCGLFYEQAQAMRALFGGRAKIYFVVGMDKLLQIFDPRYYNNRDDALHHFFTEAQLIVGGRGELGEASLQGLLEQAENKPYQDRVYFLSMPKSVKDLSSTALREQLKGGGGMSANIPEVVMGFIVETSAYSPAYELRRMLLRRLFQVREWAEENVDFAKLVTVALEDSEKGARLRKILRDEKVSLVKLKEAISALR